MSEKSVNSRLHSLSTNTCSVQIIQWYKQLQKENDCKFIGLLSQYITLDCQLLDQNFRRNVRNR